MPALQSGHQGGHIAHNNQWVPHTLPIVSVQEAWGLEHISKSTWPYPVVPYSTNWILCLQPGTAAVAINPLVCRCTWDRRVERTLLVWPVPFILTPFTLPHIALLSLVCCCNSAARLSFSHSCVTALHFQFLSAANCTFAVCEQWKCYHLQDPWYFSYPFTFWMGLMDFAYCKLEPFAPLFP